MHLNIQGANEKISQLELFLNERKNIKIVCLNEHCIKENNKYVLNTFTNFYLADGYFRLNSDGGSCILVHNSLQCFVRSDLLNFNEDYSFEGSYIEVQALNLVVISIYRIPGCKISKVFIKNFIVF